MPYDRDVRTFNDRAVSYEAGRIGQLHRDFADRAVRIALTVAPAPARVLDVGSGTGYSLRRLAGALPETQELTGVDPAPDMVRVAREASDDQRVRFIEGTAEDLPLPDASVDLVVSTTSFDHWQNQGAGLAECARVLAPGGHLVLSDLFSLLLGPTLLGARRDKARTRARANRLIRAAGLRDPRWQHLAGPIIQTVTAVK